MIVHGPVPSRRLGQSSSVNNIPPQTCSYSCIYCQRGRTNRMQMKRQALYKPEDICCEAEIKLKQLEKENANQSVISELINRGSLIEYTYEGKNFYKKCIR